MTGIDLEVCGFLRGDSSCILISFERVACPNCVIQYGYRSGVYMTCDLTKSLCTILRCHLVNVRILLEAAAAELPPTCLLFPYTPSE